MATFYVVADSDLQKLAGLTGGDNIYIRNVIFTITTDTRWHAASPASMVGTINTLQVESGYTGEIRIDATQVRWIAFTDGQNVVPAVGTIIEDGNGGSGKLLGVWESLTSAPTPVGDDVPATGFMKFSSVSFAFTDKKPLMNGKDELGTCDGEDVAGWIEVAFDSENSISTNSSISTITTIGDWFYLDDATGAFSQVVQTPTNGSNVTSSYGVRIPGVYIETDVGSGEYEFWPAISSLAYWDIPSLGMPYETTDARQKYVKSLQDGSIQIGEHITRTTYGAGTNITYAMTLATAKSYTVTAGVMKITSSSTHFIVGDDICLSSIAGGSAGLDGTYQVSAVDSSYVYVPVPGSTGSGTLSHSTYAVVTNNAHGLQITKQLTCEFASHPAFNGTKYIYYVDTNTYRINFPHSANASGNMTEKFSLGFVPNAGCKIRIPNIITRTANAAARANNYDWGGASPARFYNQSAYPGAIYDLSNLTGDCRFDSTYLSQLTIKDCAFFHNCIFSYCHGKIEIDGLGISSFTTSSNGLSTTGTPEINIINSTMMHAYFGGASEVYCENCNFVAPRARTLQTPTVKFEVNNCKFISFYLTWVSARVIITDCDVCCSTSNSFYESGTTYSFTRFLYSNSSSKEYVELDGITCGLNSTIADQVPQYIVYDLPCASIVRHVGTFAVPLLTSRYAKRSTAFAPTTIVGGSSLSTNLKIQQVFIDYCLYWPVIISSYTSEISDIRAGSCYYNYSSIPGFNKLSRGLGGGPLSGSTTSLTTWTNTHRGTHWVPTYSQTDNTVGTVTLLCMQSTPETAAYVVFDASTPERFSENAGVLLPVSGQYVEFETPYQVLGYTAFANSAATLTGVNTANFTLTYAIKTTGAYGAWTALSGANLSAETIAPDTGFSLKIRITASSSNKTNELRRVDLVMVTSAAAQQNYYPTSDPVPPAPGGVDDLMVPLGGGLYLSLFEP